MDKNPPNGQLLLEIFKTADYADGYGLLSLIEVFRGDPAKAIELNDKAI